MQWKSPMFIHKLENILEACDDPLFPRCPPTFFVGLSEVREFFFESVEINFSHSGLRV